MLRSYEIRLGPDRIAVRDAATAQMALIEHLRMAGCRDEDIVRLGTDSVAWRGAVYRAAPAERGAGSASAVFRRHVAKPHS